MTNRITDILVALGTCLCAQFETDGNVVPGFCGVIPGEAPIGSYALDCGMAWVRLTTAYPSTVVGRVSDVVGNCGKGLGFEVEIGVMRCMDMDEESPSDAELLATTQQQLDDMLTMHRAVSCCAAIGSKDYILQAYRPIGPTGGFVGGTFTLLLSA